MLRRRSRTLIDFEVQSSLVYRLCLHWFLFLVAMSFSMFCWTRLIETPTDTLSATFSRFTSTLVPLLIVSLALVPVFILDAVKLSNRFTGPIFRLRKTLSQLAQGQATRPLEFRSNDFWKSLATDFNRVTSLRERTDGEPDPQAETTPS